MKKTIIVALLALLPFGAFAQKFGHVNSAEIIPLMTEYKTAQTELEDLRKQYLEELNYMQTEYQKKEDDYLTNRESLPESIRARREQELGESQQKIAQYYQDCQVNLEQKQMDLPKRNVGHFHQPLPQRMEGRLFPVCRHRTGIRHGCHTARTRLAKGHLPYGELTA